jgi:hypothetical protein
MGVDPHNVFFLIEEGSMTALIPPGCFSKATETTEQVLNLIGGGVIKESKLQSNTMYLPSEGV